MHSWSRCSYKKLGRWKRCSLSIEKPGYKMPYDTPMGKILLLVNPVFEKHKNRDLPRIVQTFQQAGIELELSETKPERGAGEQARQAIAAGFDRIVVCGGDGTVFDVLQGMAGSSVPLGIIPFGTGNVLAQNLRIPRDPVAAARWIMAARPRSIALGKITRCAAEEKQQWFFAMTAGMGVHAALMTAAQRSKKNMGGRAAYFAAGLQLLFHHPLEPFHLTITLTTGEVIERNACEAIAVRVAALNIWRPGGGFDLPFLRLATVESGPMQNGSLHQGIRNGSRWQLARATFEGLFLSAGSRERKQRANAPARYEDASRIVCRALPGFTYTSPLAVQADGEVLDASCAVIEMAGVNLQMLSAPAS